MKRANLPVSKIASIANVSPATVSRVLNHPELVNKETRDLIEKAILDAGYDMEKVMQNKIEQNKRILLAVLPSIDNPFYNNVMKGFKTSANSHQFDVVMYLGNINRNNLEHFLDVVKMSNARGVICLNRKMDKDDRLSAGWTMEQYEHQYRQAFAEAAKAADHTWKAGKPIPEGALDGITREYVESGKKSVDIKI